MNITWLKLSVDIFSDAKIRKIRRLPDGDQMCIVWLGILCMAMKSCRPGLILICDDMPANAEDISDFVDIPVAIVEKGIKAFEQLGMVRYANGGALDVIKFAEHQQLEKIEAAKEAARLRMLEYRRRVNPNLKPRKSRKNQTKQENNSDSSVTRTQRERDATDLDLDLRVEVQLENKEVETSDDRPPSLFGNLISIRKQTGTLPMPPIKGENGKPRYSRDHSDLFGHIARIECDNIEKRDGIEAATEVFSFAAKDKWHGKNPIVPSKYIQYKTAYLADHGGIGETPDDVNRRVAERIEKKMKERGE